MTTTIPEKTALPLVTLGEQYFKERTDKYRDPHVVHHNININYESYILCWTGRRGGGKTTSMTWHACKAMAMLGMRVLSNFPIQFMFVREDGRCYPLKSEPLDLYKLLCFDESYRNCIICIDEAPDIISHMAAMTWKNRLLNIFTRQLRKNGNSLFLGAQDFNLIDKSMRWQVDVEIQCEDAFRKYGPRFKKGALILERWLDNSGVWTGETWQKKLARANARHLYKDNSWCQDMTLISEPMWGTPGQTQPAFDTSFQQDVWESLRKVDMKLTSYKVGDGQQQEAQQTADNPFTLAVGLIQAVKDNSSGIIPSTTFYGSIPNLTKVEKDKLSKAVAKLPGVQKHKVNNSWVLDFVNVNPQDLGGLI
jgi:hypothetical protein